MKNELEFLKAKLNQLENKKNPGKNAKKAQRIF
jgi:BMFP domain-containing protein YqiC